MNKLSLVTKIVNKGGGELLKHMKCPSFHIQYHNWGLKNIVRMTSENKNVLSFIIDTKKKIDTKFWRSCQK